MKRVSYIYIWVCSILAPFSSVALSATGTIDIPSQSADAALRAFAEKTGYNIIYILDDVTDTMTRTVSGVRSPDRALDIMLEGTGLVYEKTAGTTISVIKGSRKPDHGTQSGNAETGPAEMARKGRTPPKSAAQSHRIDPSEPIASKKGASSRRKQGKAVYTLDEITVTAERREALAQDTPVAVTAFGAGMIDALGIRSTEDLQMLLPSTTFTSNRVYIRGVGREYSQLGLDPGVGVYLDGFYNTENLGGVLFDYERIEIVRGPQGTLYGRNTLGGAINAVKQRPTKEWSGKVRVTAANHNGHTFSSAVGGPLYKDRLMGRLVVNAGSQDVAQENASSGTSIEGGNWYGIEMRLLFEPTDALSIYTAATTGEYDVGMTGSIDVDPYETGPAREGSVFPNPAEGYAVPNPSLQNPWVVNKNTLGIVEGEGKTVFNTATLELDAVTIKHLMSYRDWRIFLRDDADLTASPREFFWDIPMEVWGHSQELQFVYGNVDSPLSFIGGLYYWALHEWQGFSLRRLGDWGDKIATPMYHTATTPTIDYRWLPSFAGDPLRRSFYYDAWIMTRSQAVYGQADYQFTNGLNVTFGIRYSRDEKEREEERGGYYEWTGTFALDPSLSPLPDPATYTGWPAWWVQEQSFGNDWGAVSGKIGFDWKITDIGLIYGSVSQGYKSGGFILGAEQDEENDPIDPETLTAYEMGYKCLLNDSRVWIAAAAYYYDYRNMQIGTIADNRYLVSNAGSAENYGLELESMGYVTDDLLLTAAYSFTRARYKEYVTQDPEDPWEADGMTPKAIDLSGHHLNRTPEHKISLSATYTLPTDVGDFALHGVYSWQDEAYFRAFGTELDKAAAYDRMNARLSWRSPEDHWGVALYLSNASESDGYADMEISGTVRDNTLRRTAMVISPRRYGLEITYQF